MKKGGHLDGLLLLPPMTRAAALAKKKQPSFFATPWQIFFLRQIGRIVTVWAGEKKKNPYGTN